ncbi:hypothetical protein HYV85_05635 [Candidatus Woesearchaeota archaeon]|nr:hypothetical protein [Candidatus Woesearchaeota archaeon]
MPTFVRLPNLEVIYRDMWVMQPLYRATRQWFLENEYVDSQGDRSMDSGMEILYWIKKGTTMNPNEREFRIWWRTQKLPVNVGTAGSAFYKHHLDIDWNAIQTVDMEIMRDGKKEKVQFGELRILIKAYIEMPDVSKTPILGWFDYWFRTRLIKKNIEENRKMLYQDAYRLQGMIKKYLELKSFLPAEEVFHEKFEFI